MENFNIKTIVLMLIFSITSVASFGQSSDQNEPKTEVSVEIDPITFAFKGYSLHVRIKPKNCEHLLFGVGTYAMDIPSVMVDFNSKNKDKGWDVRLNQGYSAFAEHHFTEVNQKWFIGGQVGIQEYKIENSNVAGSEKFNNFLAMAYGGYTWKLFKSNLYVKPWAGLGYTTKISGENSLGDLTYDISPITMFATLHIGYTF